MKNSNLPFYLFLILFIIAACESGDEFEDEFSLVGTNTSIAELTGNWSANKAVFQSFATGPAFEVDIIADGGSVSLSIQSDGRFTVTVAPLGEPAEISTGRMAFDEDLLVISFDDEPEEYEFFSITHNEPNLNIAGGNGLVTFDFDDDGTEEPALIDFDFVRI